MITSLKKNEAIAKAVASFFFITFDPALRLYTDFINQD